MRFLFMMLKKLFITYVVLLVSFTLLMILVHMIPTSVLRENVYRSAEQIEKEGIFRKISGFYLFQIDNMTDCMMMNMAVTADDKHPIHSAMNNYYSYGDLNEGYMAMAINTALTAKEDPQVMTEHIHYGRYWQGSQVFLRPLLLITDYHGIRIINYILLSLLLIWLLFLTIHRFGLAVSILFLLSLLLVNIPIVPLSIQFSTCFYLMFLSTIFILTHSNIKSPFIFFFIIGALTSYFDFLTTPQITLGIPLIFLFLQKKKYHNPCWKVFILSLAWLLGYALLWASKWMVAYMLTGDNIMDSVIGSIELRTSDFVVFHGNTISISSLFFAVCSKIQWWIWLLIFVFSLLTIFVYIKIQTGILTIRQYKWLLLVAMIVPVWFMLLRNHTIQHIFFTWRALLVCIYSLLLFVYYTTRKYGKNSSFNSVLQ